MLKFSEDHEWAQLDAEICSVGISPHAKNNNAILRLPSLVEHNSDLAVFLLVRSPLQHAYSLMKQHEQFSAQQEGDPFIKEYMDWLGHHEFGIGQRPFILDGKGHHEGNTSDINYWLERWVNYYKNVPQSDQITVLSYEGFLADPEGMLARIDRKTSCRERV